jgi:hypothetical protein
MFLHLRYLPFFPPGRGRSEPGGAEGPGTGKGTFSKFIMPPFFGDFGIAGAAGSWGLSAGAAEAENDTNYPDGEAAEGNRYPELTESKVEAGELNIEQLPDARKQGLSQGGG